MSDHIAEELETGLHSAVKSCERRLCGHLRGLRGCLETGDHPGVYGEIAEISRHVELLAGNLRAMLIDFYGEMQINGVQPARQPFPTLPGVTVSGENGCVVIKTDAMLPFPLKGSVYYLHEKLDIALERFMEERDGPRPYFTGRCAVVFLHHYGSGRGDLRHLRDYDNVERRCITNVLAAHLLWGDSPRCMISMDVLAPGDSNYTEIRVMPIPQFRAFVMSENIEYVP